MTYQEVLSILFSKRDISYRSTLEFASELSKSLQDPHTAFQTIHVTGTNGKGSVCLKIARVLQNAGLKVGLFVSPHLCSFRERISINGVEISEERVRKGLIHLFTIAPEAGFFELATFLAFDYFREQKVEIAVIEVGIGGLLDPTNIIHPLISVITSVAQDHENLLGNSIEEIAFQKAGIIKPQTPVVLGPCANFPIIHRKARECRSLVHLVGPQLGFYDDENKAIALAALKTLQISSLQGIEERPPCRFEVRGRVILDVAHNPAGFAKLVEAYEIHFPGEPFEVVVGMSQDKDVKKCLQILTKKAAHLYLVEPNSFKPFPVSQMSQILDQEGYFHYTKGLSISASLQAAFKSGKRVVVCGSFYIMQEAGDILRMEIGQDKLFLSRC